MTSIIDFLSDQQYLGPFFEGPSWDRWRAVLKAAFALPMTDRDLELFREVAGDRNPPKKRVRELVACVGRGGGKDSIAAALAAYIAATSDFSRLRPGERGSVLCVAVDRSQASIAHDYIAALFERVPRLASMIASQDADVITLKNGAEIRVGTNSMRSVRGRTFAAAIYDETAFWRDESYSNPDSEVDAAVSPGLLRFPGSLKILISSVHRRAGLLYDRYATYFGKDDDDVLVVLGTSLQFNPTLDAKEIERHLAADEDKASSEFLSRWRDDLSSFLDREIVEAATDFGVAARPPQTRHRYVSFTDPSGGRRDSFAFAICHAEGDKVVNDVLYEMRPPFSPSGAVADVAALLRQYALSETTGDNFGNEWVVEAFKNAGIVYQVSERNRSQIYLESLPLFTTGRLRLCDNLRLRNQLIALERKANASGRDTVNHPDRQNKHDDLSNALAGAATLVSLANEGHAYWHPNDFMVDASHPLAFKGNLDDVVVPVDFEAFKERKRRRAGFS